MDASSYLFDPSLVRASGELGNEMVLRPLNRNDFKKGSSNTSATLCDLLASH